MVEKTIHCHDQEPAQCAGYLVEYVRERFGNLRIAFIGSVDLWMENSTGWKKILTHRTGENGIFRRYLIPSPLSRAQFFVLLFGW